MPSFLGLKYVYPVLITQLFNYRILRTNSNAVSVSYNGDTRWRIQLDLEPGFNGDQLLAAHRASANVFSIEMPQLIQSSLTGINDDIFLPSRHSIGATEISVRNETGNNIQINNAQFVTFGNTQKVYQIVSRPERIVNNNTTGILITPPLIDELPDNTKINFSPDISVTYSPESGGFMRTTRNGVDVRTVTFLEAL